jgi:hypothetical protein
VSEREREETIWVRRAIQSGWKMVDSTKEKKDGTTSFFSPGSLSPLAHVSNKKKISSLFFPILFSFYILRVLKISFFLCCFLIDFPCPLR